MSGADAVRETLCVLPVTAALAALAARLVGARVAALEIGLGLGWAVLAMQHERLGFAQAPLLVLALGVALSAFRGIALIPALSSCPSRRAAGAAAFFAALAFFLLLWPWSRAERAPDGDEPYYLLLTESLAHDLDVDLADEYRERAWEKFSAVPIEPQPGDPVGPGGEQWSRHAALLPLLLAPLYRVAGVAGAELGMVGVAAALTAAIFLLLRARCRAGAAPVWAIVTFAPPLAIYSGRLWVEVPAALATAIALGAFERLRHDGQGGVERRALWLLGGALIALPLLKLRFLAIALPLAALAMLRVARGHRAQRPVYLVALALGGAIVALLLWNLDRYGNPLRMYAGSELDPTAIDAGAVLRGLGGLGFDVAYGLFAWAPIWLLLIPGIALGLARVSSMPPALDARAELAVALPYLLVLSGRREWYGGWSPPFRYGIVLLPILALALAAFFAARRRAASARLLLCALAAATCVTTLVATLHPAWTFSLADGGSRALSELATIFHGDLTRFTPSFVRPRAATWLWLLALPIAVAWAAGARRSNPVARAAPMAAVALSLLGFSATLVAASRVPTRIVEAEDPWVEKEGGGLYPGPWTIDRTRYDGGWNLAAGHALAFRPVRGGDEVSVRLRAESRGSRDLALELVSGTRTVARFPPPAADRPGFHESVSEAFPIGPEERLALRAVAPTGADAGGYWIVDRLELDWR